MRSTVFSILHAGSWPTVLLVVSLAAGCSSNDTSANGSAGNGAFGGGGGSNGAAGGAPGDAVAGAPSTSETGGATTNATGGSGGQSIAQGGADTSAAGESELGSAGATSGAGGGAGTSNAGLWADVNPKAPPAWSGPSVSATVTIDPKTTVGHIGPGFVGLSYEKSHLTDQFFTATNAPLIAMFKLLGASVVRIGGNSVDRTQWQPSAPAAAVSALSSSIGSDDVDGLASFLQATGWKVIYGVNLKTSTPQLVAEEATYAANKVKTNIAAFEIGNEPDLYSQTYATWSAKWSSVATAIRSSVPNAPLAGPATAGGGLYEAVELAHDEASRLSILTQHYYRGSGKTTSPADVVMASLISPDPGLIKDLQQLSTATTTNHLPGGFRLAEANSFFAHGAPGVSNAFGSALWAIDFLFDNAENGSSGVNFHGGGAGQDGSGVFNYTPIDEVKGVVTAAQPIFYGMLLTTSAGSGPVLATTTQVSSVNFTAYAVAQNDGSTNIVLVNKDTTHAVTASVDTGAAVGAASAVFLAGASLLATSGVTFAGSGISPAGAWDPAPAWTLPVTEHVVSVVVPPASAALVHAQ